MFVVIGLDHHTTPVSVREVFSFKPGDIPHFLESAHQTGILSSGMVLSTCNRVELYAETTLTATEAESHLTRFLLEYKRLPIPYRKYIVCQSGRAAMRHLFMLTSGLLSMVRGETQILGQVKEALQIAKTSGHVDSVFLRLMEKSIETAKKVRGSQSVSYVNSSAGAAAVDKVFSLEGESLIQGNSVVVGAGNMASTVLESLRRLGVKDVALYNRRSERGERCAEKFGIQALYTDDRLTESLGGSDYVWVTTGASSPVILREMIGEEHGIMPRMIFDLAVPRNVEESVGEYEGLTLYTIDDLDSAEAVTNAVADGPAMEIIEEAIDEHIHWVEARSARSVYLLIRENAKELLDKHLEKRSPAMSDELAAEVERSCTELCEAYARQMIVRLKKISAESSDDTYADVVRKMLLA